MKRNGKASSSKHTKHISIRYYFITGWSRNQQTGRTSRLNGVPWGKWLLATTWQKQIRVISSRSLETISWEISWEMFLQGVQVLESPKSDQLISYNTNQSMVQRGSWPTGVCWTGSRRLTNYGLYQGKDNGGQTKKAKEIFGQDLLQPNIFLHILLNNLTSRTTSAT